MSMDHGGDGLERRISLEATARYAPRTTVLASVHQAPPALPARTSPSRPQPPIPTRAPVSASILHSPVSASILRSVPPAPLREPPQPREIITLDQARPEPRRQNDYVDSPHWAALRGLQQSKANVLHPPHTGLQNKTNIHSPPQQKTNALHTANAKSLQSPSSGVDSTVGFHLGGGSSHDQVISRQPQSALKKDVVEGEEEGDTPAPCQDSIICSQCGKCRCQACTQPRELPRRWFCNNKCECSMQRMVDVCSCLCCVRALFYHCVKDRDGDESSASDDPCACCEAPNCCRRWLCLGMLSICLPCLCLYWPLKCGLCACTSLYNSCTRQGCHCRRDRLPGSKRLLIDSESSST